MSSSFRRRTNYTHQSAEQEALSQVAREAEQRLAAKKQARTEARQMRLREIERQQIEDQEKSRESKERKNYSGFYNLKTNDENEKPDIHELEERLSRTLAHVSQLDNEKQTIKYRLQVTEETCFGLKEELVEAQRQIKEKNRDLEQKRKSQIVLEELNKNLKEHLQQRDQLIKEHGFVFVSDDINIDNKENKMDDNKNKDNNTKDIKNKKCALVSNEALDILENFSGSLDERLLQMDNEKKDLEKVIKKLQRQLEEEKNKRNNNRLNSHSPTPSRGLYGNQSVANSNINKTVSSNNMEELANEELQRKLDDYKFKLKKSQQEIISLEGNVTRLESQVKKLKISLENSEENEEEMKKEKRKINKEMNKMKEKVEELELEKERLEARMEKNRFKSKY